MRFLADMVYLLLELNFHRLTRSFRVVWNPLARSLAPLVCEDCHGAWRHGLPTA